ncbi:MAG: beta-propeller fold lactonase family protein [Verrucomicrobia bacterium]|nr:beta-propeller fold lactonase family protein [Verrucomicrobiota bacterium]
MLLRTHFVACASLLTAATSPLSAEVAYISDCPNNPSVIGVFQTSTRKQKVNWTVGKNAFQAVYSPDATRVYVSNTNSQSVSVLNSSTGLTLASIRVGFSVQWEAISPDGSKLYVESFDAANLYHIVAIDTALNTVSAKLAIHDFAVDAMTLSPDGNTLYVVGSLGLYVIDANSLRVTQTVSALSATSQAVTPDGKYLYIASPGNTGDPQESVQVVSTTDFALIKSVPLPSKVSAGFIKITPDGSQAWLGEFPMSNGVLPIIVVISTGTFGTSTITLPASQSPGAILFSPDSSTAYVPVNGPQIAVMNVATRQTVALIDSIPSVGELAISPDGSTLLSPSSSTSNLVAISGASVVAKVPVGAITNGSQLFLEYGGVAVSRDGKRAYVTNFASGALAAVDTASKKVVYSVPVGSEPVSVVVSPDNAKVYVANSFSNSITVIDAQTFKSKTIVIPKQNQGYPSSIAIAPDGKTVYVTVNNLQPDFGNAICWIVGIDTGTHQVSSATRIRYPMALTLSPDGAKIYVIGGISDTLYTISTATHLITHKVSLRSGSPTQPVTGGIAVTPDGTKVFATDSASAGIFEVDVTTQKLVKMISAGQAPGSLAITPDGSQLWATDLRGTSALVIDIATGALVNQIALHNQSYGIAFGPE